MTQREALLKIWRKEKVEFMPFYMDFCPSQIDKFHSVYGNDKEILDVFDMALVKIFGETLVKPQNDNWSKFFPNKKFNEGTIINPWGEAHEPVDGSMHLVHLSGAMEHFERLEEYENFPYPVLNEDLFPKLKTQIAKIKTDGRVATGLCGKTVWERAWAMYGMDKLMLDMYTEEDSADFHIKKIGQITKSYVKMLVEAGVDHIHLGDDIGMQTNIMISVDMYCKYIKPVHKEIIEMVRAMDKNIIISYHSDGFIEPFIDHIVEIGVDVLNPVQPECMDFKTIFDKYKDVLSFWGGIGVQSTMPFGTPEDVKNRLKELMEIAGPTGGLFPTPAHMIEPEVPWENVEAYVQACKEFKF